MKKADTFLNIGSLAYNPNKILMYDYDGNAIFTELETKIKDGSNLSDVDMVNLIFLPLMRNTISKDTLAVNSIKLAQTIDDKGKRNTCIASIFAFASKYLKENEVKELLEVLRMTDLATMLIEDAVSEREIDIVKKALKKGATIEFVQEITGLDEYIIEKLQLELYED